MSQVFAAERVEKKRSDFLLICSLVLLMGVGMVVLFSSSYYRSDAIFDSPFRLFLNQAIYAGVGLVLAFIASRVPLEKIRALLPWLLLGSLVLMLMTFLPGVGLSILGGRRWIVMFGSSFQPSEVVKLALVFYLASVLDKKQAQIEQPSLGLVPPFLMVLVFALLIFMQNNISTAVFVLVVSLSIFFAAGVKARYFLLTLVLVVPLAIASLFSREHRLIRILTYIKPEDDPTQSGYQILASLSSLKNGSLLGVGIGAGTHKLGVLPEAHSDFIFAVLGEELGFLGIVAIVVLFAFFAWRGYSVAMRSKSMYFRLLAFGITTTIALQSMVNMAVVSGLIPTTGIPLPFFSAGGSSLLITLVMCGILVNVSRQADAGGRNG